MSNSRQERGLLSHWPEELPQRRDKRTKEWKQEGLKAGFHADGWVSPAAKGFSFSCFPPPLHIFDYFKHIFTMFSYVLVFHVFNVFFIFFYPPTPFRPSLRPS